MPYAVTEHESYVISIMVQCINSFGDELIFSTLMQIAALESRDRKLGYRPNCIHATIRTSMILPHANPTLQFAPYIPTSQGRYFFNNQVVFIFRVSK